MLQIHQFICRSDNFGVLVHDPETGATAAIDAPDGTALLSAIGTRGWTLSDVLVTHHHADHIDGIPELKQRYPQARITAPVKDRARIPEADVYVGEDDTVIFGSTSARVIETPGHTTGHIVFFFEQERLLFAGDTLFAMGCGRVLETPMATMYGSLEKLMKLPGDTQIYCGHEYTMSNAKFAVTVDPRNARLQARAQEVVALRAGNQMTLPTRLDVEFATNPFLRAADPEIQGTLGLAGADPSAVFAELRTRKDRF